MDTIAVIEVKNEVEEGQLTLFDMSTIEEIEVEERKEDEVEEPFEIEGQLNLFSPDEFVNRPSTYSRVGAVADDGIHIGSSPMRHIGGNV